MSDQVAVPPEDKPVVERIKARRRELGLTQAAQPTCIVRVPTAKGSMVELTVETSRVLSAASPGYALHEGPGRARILLAPGLLEMARAGDREARLVVLHELAHVVLHSADEEAGRDCEAEADAFAAAVLALITPDMP